MTIQPFVPQGPAFETLRISARTEAYQFIEKLKLHWDDGSDRYALPGETFLSVVFDDQLAAVGGLNHDPYLNDGTGRIRHVYVMPDFRRRKVGSELVCHLIEQAKGNFPALRLRAANEAAAIFYDRLGFQRISHDTATHWMEL